MPTDNFSTLPFSQCIGKISIKHKIKQKDYLASGKYPVIDQGQSFISGYCDDEIAIKIKKPIIVFGDHTRCFKFVDFNFVAGADGIHILEPKYFFNEKLFYYFCLALDFPNKGYSRHFQYLAKTTMKIPPLEIQKRIVARLESAFEKIEKGSAHLQDAKTKLAEYKQSLLKSAFDGTLFCHTEGEARSISNQESRDISLTLNMTNSPSLRASVASVAIQNNDTTKALDCHSPKGFRNDSTHSSLRANNASVAKHKKQILVILTLSKAKGKYPKNQSVDISLTLNMTIWILRFLRKLRMTKIEIFHLRLNITKLEMTVLSTTANHAS